MRSLRGADQVARERAGVRAPVSEKQARSIKYQLTVAKLPLAKDVDDFTFKTTPINEALVRDLAGGGFLAQQRVVPRQACPHDAKATPAGPAGVAHCARCRGRGYVRRGDVGCLYGHTMDA